MPVFFLFYSMLLHKYHSYLANEKRFSTHTVKNYLSDLKQYKNFLRTEYEENCIEKSNYQQVRSWIVYLIEKKISARSVNRKLSSLKSYFKFAKRENIISHNPIAKVVAPKTSKKLPVFVEPKNMNFLLNSNLFETTYKGIRDRVIVELFYSTGIRLSELINLKETDITSEKIKVLGKRNKERIIPITNILAQLLSEYLVSKKEQKIINKENYLFVTDKGEKMYEKFVYRIVNNYLSLVTSISKTSPHVLRHTFATHMLNNGADLNSIKELLGHANLSATQVYTHNSIEKLKNTYKQAHPRG